MRIISGNFKNKKLFFPKNLKTRPLKDSVRENLFNILEHSSDFEIKIKNSHVMDLYAGAGSFGFECLSREASQVYFVEKDPDALINLKKNIENFKVQRQTVIFAEDISKVIVSSNFDKKVNIAFMDPPYSNKKNDEIIEIIRKQNVLSEKHILILHVEKNKNINLYNKFNIVDNRSYGRSELLFIRLF